MSNDIGERHGPIVVRSWRQALAAGIPVRGEPAVKRNNKSLSKHRDAILALQGGLCLLCAEPVRKPSIDHMIPLSRGGSNRIRNLAVACSDCNNKRQSRLLTAEQRQRAIEWFIGSDGDRRIAIARRTVTP